MNTKNTQNIGASYKMSQLMFDELAKHRSNKSSNPYTYVLNIINEQFGIKQPVVKLIIG